MEPLFRLRDIPWRVLYKCGRQVGKSQSISAQGIIQSSMIPNFNTLYVLPLAEMTRRLSSNYVRPLIAESPVKDMLIDPGCQQAVLQKSFLNGSIMFFSYAFLNCDRIRGIAADKIGVDEAQDMNWEFLPIVRECMSASRWGYEQYTCTPKTFDNTAEALWEESSKAEWAIRCGCGFYNIPSQDYHVHAMIGSVESVQRHGTGLICAKCGRPLNASKGSWIHRHADRRITFCGYHVPQIVMKMHYADERKWAQLLHKRDKMPPAFYLNEVIGESCDVGKKLVTQTELQRACRLEWHNDFNEARLKVRLTERYEHRVLGIDWGGGGMDEISYTTIAVMGMSPLGRLDVIYGERLHTATGDVEEVRRILELYRIFQCSRIAHDFGGSGSVHETLMLQAGLSYEAIIPLVYVCAPTRNIIYAHTPEVYGSRAYYGLDKTRSLLVCCALVKTGYILFPKWESSKDLLEDFLHLVEDKKARPTKADVKVITKQPKTSDDFANSVNYGAWGLFRLSGKYPDIAFGYNLNVSSDPHTDQELERAEQQPPVPPGSGVDWNIVNMEPPE